MNRCFIFTLVILSVAGCAKASSGMRETPGPGVFTLRTGDIPLWYRVAGVPTPGIPPVVFLHGGPGQGSEHFEILVGQRYDGRLQMVYLDQRGSGRSGRGPAESYTISSMVDDIELLRQALRVDRIALVAHSFGGVLALEYAARYPAHVSSVVFAAGLWDVPYQTPLRRGEMFLSPELPARLDSIERATGRKNTGEVGAALGRAGLGRYQFTAFDRLTMPVLVIAGRQDGAAVPEGLRELARRLPNARYLEYENSGHFVYLDEPDRFARDVEAFIRGHP